MKQCAGRSRLPPPPMTIPISLSTLYRCEFTRKECNQEMHKDKEQESENERKKHNECFLSFAYNIVIIAIFDEQTFPFQLKYFLRVSPPPSVSRVFVLFFVCFLQNKWYYQTINYFIFFPCLFLFADIRFIDFHRLLSK